MCIRDSIKTEESHIKVLYLDSMQISYGQVLLSNEKQCIMWDLSAINRVFYNVSIYVIAGTRRKVHLTQDSTISRHDLTGFYYIYYRLDLTTLLAS